MALTFLIYSIKPSAFKNYPFLFSDKLNITSAISFRSFYKFRYSILGRYSFQLNGNLCFNVTSPVRGSKTIFFFNGIRFWAVVFIRFLLLVTFFLGTANQILKSSCCCCCCCWWWIERSSISCGRKKDAPDDDEEEDNDEVDLILSIISCAISDKVLVAKTPQNIMVAEDGENNAVFVQRLLNFGWRTRHALLDTNRIIKECDEWPMNIVECCCCCCWWLDGDTW